MKAAAHAMVILANIQTKRPRKNCVRGREIVYPNFVFTKERLEFSFRSPVLRKALCAVDRPSLGRLKWDLGLFPAVRTGDIMHYSWRSSVVATSASISRSVSVVSPISITHFLKTLRLYALFDDY